jgi:hypothetical protein
LELIGKRKRQADLQKSLTLNSVPKNVKVSNEELDRIKNQLNVPLNLRSCHTMVYEGRFIEERVPPKGVSLVLREKNIKGVASPHGVKSGRGSYEDNYEVVRFAIINYTTMHHSIHLHGMWTYLDNGGDAPNPRKHTIDLKPGEAVFVNVKADSPGLWAFHCHVLYHMDASMFRVVRVR